MQVKDTQLDIALATADSDLASQYGLCEPEALFNDLKGDSTRPQPGCASLKTGNRSATGVDPNGYSFLLTVRIVSIGSTYN